jgi:hypothetical protein
MNKIFWYILNCNYLVINKRNKNIYQGINIYILLASIHYRMTTASSREPKTKPVVSNSGSSLLLPLFHQQTPVEEKQLRRQL